MPFLIDSDVLIAHREGEPGALDLIARLAPSGLAISIITYMEVYQGTLRSSDPERARAGLVEFLAGVPVVPFSMDAARRCADLREDLARQGKRVRGRSLDLMIAATAQEHGYTLVTHNRKDYADIAGLALFELT
jgi:predicted nucleic acid-binding protein